MSLRELDNFINSFDTERWYELSENERLSILQQFENIMAKIQGREPIRIEVLSDEIVIDRPGLMGGYNRADKVIHINPKFLRTGRPGAINGVSYFGATDALDTIAHEGRHAWQHYVIEHPEENIVDRDTRIRLQINSKVYFSPGDGQTAYEAQILELDARRFALQVISYFCDKLEERDGHINLQFYSAVRKHKAYERNVAQRIVKELDIDDIDEFDKKVRESFDIPGVDLSEISIFAEAKELFKGKSFDKFAEGKPLMTIGTQIFDEKQKYKDVLDKYRKSDIEIKPFKSKVKLK